ncbi:RibD family protein [Streptosporangium sp. NPDC000396]|uniref:RibD family protein n=1 Tax=Streptosporangium sp. NPDC000396 TaxID=3366185 RepID=UPI0036AC08B1
MRPYTILSCAMSLDARIDDASDRRLILSNEADLDRVDALRADCDAILVGAGTIRADNPRLRVRSAARVEARLARGCPAQPLRVTVTATGLAPDHQFFYGEGDRLVYAPTPALSSVRRRLAGAAAVANGGNPLDLGRVLDDLGDRGVTRLLVEGGTTVHTQFLSLGLADELQLVVSPMLIGDRDAPAFFDPGAPPTAIGRDLTLEGVRQIGDVVLLRYRLTEV